MMDLLDMEATAFFNSVILSLKVFRLFSIHVTISEYSDPFSTCDFNASSLSIDHSSFKLHTLLVEVGSLQLIHLILQPAQRTRRLHRLQVLLDRLRQSRCETFRRQLIITSSKKSHDFRQQILTHHLL